MDSQGNIVQSQIRVLSLNLLGDAALDQFGRARIRFRVVVSNNFGEVVQRLGGPEDLHPLLGVTRQFRLDTRPQ